MRIRQLHSLASNNCTRFKDKRDHVANATDSVSIIDTVTYSGLKVGETYTITGTLMDADTGKNVLDDDGNEITASKNLSLRQKRW